jgi:hypothetical protein
MNTKNSEHLTPALSPERRGSESSPPSDPRDEMLTKKELAGKLKVTVRTIENWQREGFLPYMKISSVVLFHWPEIVEHLKANFKVCRRGVVSPRS